MTEALNSTVERSSGENEGTPVMYGPDRGAPRAKHVSSYTILYRRPALRVSFSLEQRTKNADNRLMEDGSTA
jgi:hypothetical protein